MRNARGLDLSGCSEHPRGCGWAGMSGVRAVLTLRVEVSDANCRPDPSEQMDTGDVYVVSTTGMAMADRAAQAIDH